MSLKDLIAEDLAHVIKGEASVTATVTPQSGAAAYDLTGIYRAPYIGSSPGGVEVGGQDHRMLCLTAEVSEIRSRDAVSIPDEGEFTVAGPPRKNGVGMSILVLLED